MKKHVCAISLTMALLSTSGVTLAACGTQPINFGDTKNGVLATDDCVNTSGGNNYYYDSYGFSGVAGQQIAIFYSSSAFNPFLFLVYPDKTFISDNDSGGGVNARIPTAGFLTLTQTGTYEIQAVTAAPLQVGAYALTLTSAAPAGCTVVAAPASSATSPLAAGTSVQLTASCSSGQQPITYTWDSGAFIGSVRSVAPTATTTYSMIASNASGSAPAVTTTVTVSAPPPTGQPTVEFYNINLAHYFLTAVQAEATGIDNGAAGPGWVRTGFSFDVFANPVTADLKALTTSPVCRFYAPGANTHFFTVDSAECAQVKLDPGWHYEGIAFNVQAPQFGSCPAGTQPIYRVYNNRAAFNDSNHRFITNQATFLQMGDQGWTLEGVVMCTTSVRAPTPVTGGTFNGPNGAAVTVAPGQIPPAVNATAPSLAGAPALPPGMNINPQVGDTNVTQGAPGYTFNLTGDSAFTTPAAGAVTITLPFNAAAIPAADQGDPIKTFTRVFNPQDSSQVDLTGAITIAGSNSKLTVETRGLPKVFTAAVIYNPNMESATSDEATVAIAGFPTVPTALKVAKTTWPAQSWCVIWNHSNPNLIAAVQTLHGLAGNPSIAQIRSDIVNLVAGGAKKSQLIYQNDGMNGPNLFIGTTCGGTVQRYNIHMVDGGSLFRADDPGEVVSSGTEHFGRLYIDNGRLDDSINTVLGTVLASISHEMLHGIQNGYGILGATPRGYKEGSAATYGKSIDNGQTIRVRNETESLALSLMASDRSVAYGNEDFFAYIGRQYNAGSLNYLSGLFAQMNTTIGANVLNPDPSLMYGALNIHIKNAFPGQTLQTVYLDFLKQRALTHNAASQMGRAGEVVSGYAPALFGSGAFTQSMDVSTANCGAQKINLNYPGLSPFSARAIVINPIGVVPQASNGPSLNVKITPASSSIGGLWNGFTFRTGTTTALAAANKFTGFGKLAGDQVVVIVANLDPTNTGSFVFEISCGGLHIDSIAPVKGPPDTLVTITGTGFGTSTDTRTVTFNGVTPTTFNFNSDTEVVARVPANAASGDVVVTVNGENSNGVNFEVVSVCSATQNAGGDTPDTRTIELGKPAGAFVFSYDTYSQQDEIIVRYQGTTLFDTGCVGASGSPTLHYSGTSTQISVQVIPNCAGGTGTAWTYSVSCP